MYQILIMSQAQKDAKKLAASGLKPKVLKLLELIQADPFVYPPAFEYLQGNMKGLISRRINKQHRLVYEVFEQEQLIKVYRMWTHYE
ncbi:MAG: Txe/YoeB family addiction module toxin [Thiomicrospira sp.]|uniref:Txe/YoeB family addiction module toxin n=1 Tax=Thiomicrospira sp. TaxID=935 RepID=UPI0019EDEDFD|nr:Txe/YoeB family addiction module toxin [Thiomicrospira sp.]MBE0494575.1 Txe/YoeB family addiction module toxin [Thiomicrospira sp.]